MRPVALWLIAALTFSVAQFVSATSALASGPARIAIIPIETSNAAPDDGERLLAAIRTAMVESPDFEEHGRIEMTLDEARLSFDCMDESAPCMAQIGAIYNADRLLWGVIAQTEAGWKLSLTLIDVPGASVLRRREWTALADLTVAESEAVAFTLGHSATALVAVRVTSRPSAAEVSVDGELRGVTPVDLTLAPGEHVFELRSPGRNTQRRTLDVADGRGTLDVAFGPPVGAPSGTDASEAPRSPAFWLGVGAGAVALGAATAASVWGLRVEELSDEAADQDTSEIRRSELEPEFEDTKLLTNVAWGVAAVAGATSVYFFVFHEDETHSLQVSTDGRGLVLGGRF